MSTDISEKGLETLIMRHMTGEDGFSFSTNWFVAESPSSKGNGWLAGNPKDFDKAQAVDLAQLFTFLRATQSQEFKKLGITDYKDSKDIARLKFLTRLSNEIGKRGVIDVLRHGVQHGQAALNLFYGTPSPENEKSKKLFARNRFSVTRQLRYSLDETKRALDLCLFINGLPIATFELKNSLTKQTVEDAVEQYRRDRDPRELLFQFGRCIVHLAVDDAEMKTPGRSLGERRGEEISDSALGREWKIQFNRLAGASADRAAQRRQGAFRFDRCYHGPTNSRSTDP